MPESVLPVEVQRADPDYLAVFDVDLGGIGVLGDAAEGKPFDDGFFWFWHLVQITHYC